MSPTSGAPPCRRPRASPTRGPSLRCHAAACPMDTWTMASSPRASAWSWSATPSRRDRLVTTQASPSGTSAAARATRSRSGATATWWRRKPPWTASTPSACRDRPAPTAVVRLPERMGPTVTAIRAVSGATVDRARLAAAPLDRLRRLDRRGLDRIDPDDAWPVVVGRTYGVDVANLGYSGTARRNPHRRGARRPRRRRHHHRPRHQLLDPHPVQRRHVPRGAHRLPRHRPPGPLRHPDRGRQPDHPPRRRVDAEPPRCNPHRPASRVRARRRSTASPLATPS